MERIFIFTLLVFFSSMAAFSQTMKGPLKLVDEANEDNAPVVKGKSGPVEYDMKFVHGDFFDKPASMPHPNVKNTSAKKIHFSLAIALFDATGTLVAAASQDSELEANESSQMGSFLMYVSNLDIWKKVASYQLVTFTRDVQ